MIGPTWAFVARIVAEKRVAVTAVAVALAIDGGLWAVAVYPWTVKVANVERRAAAAAAALEAAELRFDAANGNATAMTGVDQDLAAFRRDLLPADLAAARAVAFARLASLVDVHGLVMERRASEIDSDEVSDLERLRVSMVVRGAYADLRQFIAAVETAPEFLVIEEILLSGGEDAAGLQVLTLGLATYYWDGGAETAATEQPDATSAEP